MSSLFSIRDYEFKSASYYRSYNWFVIGYTKVIEDLVDIGLLRKCNSFLLPISGYLNTKEVVCRAQSFYLKIFRELLLDYSDFIEVLSNYKYVVDIYSDNNYILGVNIDTGIVNIRFKT